MKRTTVAASGPVEIVHDFMVGVGGAERVAVALASSFGASVTTLLHRPQTVFDVESTPVRALWPSRIRPLREHHRWSLPIAAATFARTRVDAPLTICSSSGFSHAVETTGPKIVYCHTPARWLHDTDRYLRRFGPVAGVAATRLRSREARRDLVAMRSADRVVANSSVIADQIGEIYGIEARVVAPPSTLDLDRPLDAATERHLAETVGHGYVLCPSRALGYKRLDVLLDAARRLPDLTFVHVGDGPERRRLVATAPENVRLLGEVDDAALVWLYRHAGLVALTSAEDFGLVPVEARAFGVASVVPEARGFLDHVRPDENGWFYPLGDAAALAEVVSERVGARVEAPVRDPLGRERFACAMREVATEFVPCS